ncbi:cdc42 effector protein 2-like [Ambystoma mexicanum]|uniref:cdc42 effector protein 2-like n=1 Tax=Ambystoma mexicanum TaxID=8296 RepID=UPI0037E8E28A
MPAKTPMYLKTSTPKRGKKLKLRDVLSSEMISPPLGDFRHSAHIGLDGEGDMFGELSFLQGKYDLLPSFTRKFTFQRTEGSLNEDYGMCSPPGGYRSFLKSAVSLPVFSGMQNPEQAPPKPPRLHLEEAPNHRSMSVSCGESFHSNEEMSFSSIPHHEQINSSTSYSAVSISSSEDSLSCSREPDSNQGVSSSTPVFSNTENLSSLETDMPKSESLLGLDLDLGPSILDDVLRIMDDYKTQDTKEL